MNILDKFFKVPSADSTDNATVRDAIGNKTDTTAGNSIVSQNKNILARTGDVDTQVSVPFTADTESILAYLQTRYYHVHGASFLYPDKAIPVSLTANAAAWNEIGTIYEVIPANTITKAFDLHWASITSISATLDGVIDIFKGASGSEVKIASVDVSRTSNHSREAAMPVQVPQQSANSRISCRFTSSTTNANTVSVKFYGHVYDTSL